MKFDDIFDDDWIRRWEMCGFGLVEIPDDKRTAWFLPYWSVVLPRIVLSAWVLLSKPRKASTRPRGVGE